MSKLEDFSPALAAEHAEIDKLPWPRESREDLKALVTTIYVLGYAEGWQACAQGVK